MIQKFKIPLDEHNGRLATFIQRTMNKYMKDMNTHEKEAAKKQYKGYIAQRRVELEKFAEANNISVSSLRNLITRDQNKDKNTSDAKEAPKAKPSVRRTRSASK